MASLLSLFAVILQMIVFNVQSLKHCLVEDRRESGQPYFYFDQIDETEECMICNPTRMVHSRLCTELKRTVIPVRGDADRLHRQLVCGGSDRSIKCSAVTDWGTAQEVGPRCDADDSMMVPLTAEAYFNDALLAWTNRPTRGAVLRFAFVTVGRGNPNPITSANDYDINSNVPPSVFFDWFWLYNLKKPCIIDSLVPYACSGYDRDTFERDDRYIDWEHDPTGNTRVHSGGDHAPFIHTREYQKDGRAVKRCIPRHNTVQSVRDRVNTLFGNVREGDACINQQCRGAACNCYRWHDGQWNELNPAGAVDYVRYLRERHIPDKFKCLSPPVALIAQQPPQLDIPGSTAPKNRDGDRYCPDHHQWQAAHMELDNDFVDDEDEELGNVELKWLKTQFKKIEMLKKEKEDNENE